jgi:thiamine-phosphate pyrophosphorylase
MGALADQLAVYVVTDSEQIAAAAIAGGAGAVQLRAPGLADRADRAERELLPLARRIAARCREAGVLFVVNDSVPVAVRSGAGGVHLGQSDRFALARAALPAGAVLGVSLERPWDLVEAEAAGADYVALTVWGTPTKPAARPLGPAAVRAVAAAARVPVVGIGGIGPVNAAEVIAAGAAGVAVISAVSGVDDPIAAVGALQSAVRAAKEERDRA